MLAWRLNIDQILHIKRYDYLFNVIGNGLNTTSGTFISLWLVKKNPTPKLAETNCNIPLKPITSQVTVGKELQCFKKTSWRRV